MRFALFCILLGGCGSACGDFVTLYCGLSSSCLGVSRTVCETEARRFVSAAKYTEEQCDTARDRVAKMTCPQFRAFIDANSR